METISKRKRMRLFTLALFSTSLCWMLVLGSCRDNDYDLSNIDETIGLGGGDTLTLPGNNSTRAIQMDEVLKLNNSSFVHIATNGDYELSMTDGSVHRQTVTVGSFVISGSSVESYSIPAVPGSVDKPIVTLNFVAHCRLPDKTLYLGAFYSSPDFQVDSLAPFFPAYLFVHT